ncbi:hypothetical protein K1T71_007950 [Dendrolimus kikuchii]|uniref:Uncharacterized protein n=1 Tax=Dendrolimus kikuchii TaxID=765133 RepID=A0ACC1CYV2_9NEOP|nr:hypothetical protein K1T71_007950 [Dendrolimus kikuchii]
MKIRMKTRERGDNWTSRDKELIIELMKDSAKIVDNKSIDAKSVMQKTSEWLKIQKKFCDLSGTTRSIHQLKGAWRRIRYAKTIDSQNKIVLKVTEGDKKSPSPSQENRQITDSCSTDFITVKGEHDNDSIFQTMDIQENDAIIIDHNIFDNNTNTKRNSKLNKKIIEQDETNINMKEKCMKCCEDEQALKIKYWQKELSHQELKHKLELEILTLEKRKKDIQENDAIIIDHNIFDNNTNTKRNSKLKKKIIEQDETNINMKEKCMKCCEDEQALKIKYWQKELSHQELKHKLELEILTLEKRKKVLEILKLE